MGKVKITTEPNKTKGQEIEVPCSKCSTRTSHLVLQSVDESGHEETPNWAFQWDNTYQIIQCQGCKTISFRHVHINSEDYEQVGEDEWENTVYENLYPRRMEGRKGLKDTLLLPPMVRDIYGETNNANSLMVFVYSPVLASGR